MNPAKHQQVFVGTQDGLFLSDDMGDHWREVGQSIPEKDIQCILVEKTATPRLFVGTPSGVYFADINRLDWSRLPSKEDIGLVRAIELDGANNRIIVGTTAGLVAVDVP